LVLAGYESLSVHLSILAVVLTTPVSRGLPLGLGEKHLNRCICNFGFSGLAKSGYLLGKTHFSLTPGASKWSAAAAKAGKKKGWEGTGGIFVCLKFGMRFK
jgi:hypothetical protein